MGKQDDNSLRAKAEAQVAQSIAARRRMFNANGIPANPDPLRPGPVPREVDNPLLTDGLYYGGRRDTAKITVHEAATTRIGALSFIRPYDKKKGDVQPGRRFPYHEQAAERFKSDYEALYGSAGGAVDPSNEPVDTSVVAHDNGLAARLDRGERLRRAKDYLGKGAFNEMIDMLIFCTPASEYADIMPSGQRNQRQISKIEEARLAILESLSIHWGFRTRAA